MKKMVFVLLSYAILIGVLPYNKIHNSHPEIPQDAQFSEAATDLHAVPENDENRALRKGMSPPAVMIPSCKFIEKSLILPPIWQKKKNCAVKQSGALVPSRNPGWIHSSGWQHPSSICIQETLKDGSRTVHPISVTRSKISTAMVLSN